MYLLVLHSVSIMLSVLEKLQSTSNPVELSMSTFLSWIPRGRLYNLLKAMQNVSGFPVFQGSTFSTELSLLPTSFTKQCQIYNTDVDCFILHISEYGQKKVT